MKLDEITVGTRHRRDLGDIDALAESMKTVGLLHPVVVNESGELVAGERRLAAAKRLGWKDVAATVAKTLDDVHNALLAERDENTCRKDFTPSEAIAMAKALQPFEKAAAQARRASSNDERVNLTHSEKGKASDKIADAVGMGRTSLTRAAAVVEAAEEYPQHYSDVAEEMDRTGKVTPAYEEVARRQQNGDAPKTHLPHQPRRHKPTGGEVWSKVMAECTRVLIDTRDAGDIEGLVDAWAPGEEEEYLEMLRGFRKAADRWITYLEKRCRKLQKAK